MTTSTLFNIPHHVSTEKGQGLMDVLHGKETLHDYMVKKQSERDSRAFSEVFTIKEQLKIGLSPLVMQMVVWRFVKKVCDYNAQHKIPQLTKVTRMMREEEKKWYNYINKDLDAEHIRHLQEETERFCGQLDWDFTTFYYSINNQIKKHYPNVLYDEMRTWAYMAICTIDVLRWLNGEVDKLISQKVLRQIPETILNPYIKATECLLIACIGECNIPEDQNIYTAVEIFKNNLKRTQFNIIHSKPKDENTN